MSSSFRGPRRTVLLALGLMLGLVAVDFTPARADAVLRWKFREGQTLNYQVTTSTKQEMTVNGKPLKMDMEQVIDQTWKVEKVASDGTGTITQTTKDIRLNMKNTQGEQSREFKYNTADKDKPTDPFAQMMAQVMEPMIGKSVTIEVNPRGELVSFKADEEMFSGVKKSPGMEQMAGMFTEEGMKRMTAQAMFKFPEKKLAKGDSWTNTLEMPDSAIGKQKVDTKYTYVGADERDGQKVEKVDMQLKLTFEVPKDAPSQMEIKDQKSAGALYFDNAGGHVLESDSSTTMKMEISAGGMKVENTTTSTTTMKLVKDEDKKKDS